VDKATSRRKDASDEAQLWTSLQSLADDEDLLDSLNRSAADAPAGRLVPPAQFRRPTPPSVSIPRHSTVLISFVFGGLPEPNRACVVGVW